jgi:DUF2917 family protein
MILDTKRVVIELKRRGIVPVEVTGSAWICCLRGRVWITEYRSTGDIVLEAGESCETARNGVVVVQALRDARVAFLARGTSQAAAALAFLRRRCARTELVSTLGAACEAISNLSGAHTRSQGSRRQRPEAVPEISSRPR